MLIYFSSGTTGMPKMIFHDFEYPLGHIVTAKYWQKVEDGGLHLTVSDSGWAKFGWGKIYGQWICGAVIVAYDTEKFEPVKMLETIHRLKLTTFCAPPTVYRFLIKEDLSKCDFSTIHHAGIAGEPLNPEVFYKFKEATGLEVTEGFGQSETSVLIANFGWFPIKPGSTGKFSPLYDLDIVDENGVSCEDGIVGSIVVKNTDKQHPTGLFHRYYRDEEATAAAWQNGVYNTGDTAWRDAEGYIWFVGRNDDVIKCSGYRIGPFEVESALLTHPSVLECAVTAVPDPVRGQVVKATVVLARGYEGSDALKKELQNHVKRVTAPYKYPRVVEFVSELPKTVSGKIRRVQIRKEDEEKK
jgi:acetyl-CoA synthetase